MMKGKIFCPDEANRMLPLVSRITDDIVGAYQDVHQALQAFEAAKAEAGENPTDQNDAVLHRLDADVARHLDRFQGLIEEIEALGGTVRDYEHGCVDFYGDVDGEIVYLCWRRGELTVGHWHRLDEGFAKRQPLAVPSAA
jgi:hypothetical protein